MITKEDIESYNWKRHIWGAGRGGYNPELISKWRHICDRLLQGIDGVMVTTDGGWPRVGWSPVLSFEMRETWPYNHLVPSVLLKTPLGGGEWHPVMSLTELQEI